MLNKNINIEADDYRTDADHMKDELFHDPNDLVTPEIEAKFGAGSLAKYPPSLIKAIYDPFCYAMKLKTGDVFFFEKAVFASKDYVWIKTLQPRPTGLSLDRGVHINVSEIVWFADAPNGS